MFIFKVLKLVLIIEIFGLLIACIYKPTPSEVHNPCWVFEQKL